VATNDQQANLAEWLTVCDALIDAAEAIVRAARADRANLPHILLMAILARSVSNLRAVRLLAKSGLFVEARSITRSLYENFFLAGAILVEPQRTCGDLKADHEKSKRRRGKILTDNTETYSPAQIDEIRRVMEELGPGRLLSPTTLAERASLNQYLIYYAQLSSDSTHASLDSLEHYLLLDEDSDLKQMQVEPRFSTEDLADTVGWACQAFGGVLRIAQTALGNENSLESFNHAESAYTKLMSGQITPDEVGKAPDA
jgi:hypothetical protein